MNKNILTRKLYSGLLLIGFLLFILLMSALLMGWNLLDGWLVIAGISALYLTYAPLWSIFSDYLSKNYARLPSNRKLLSLVFHLLGGLIAAIVISFYPRYIDAFLHIDVNSLFLLIIYGCLFAFPFWITDSILLERTREN